MFLKIPQVFLSIGHEREAYAQSVFGMDAQDTRIGDFIRARADDGWLFWICFFAQKFAPRDRYLSALCGLCALSTRALANTLQGCAIFHAFRVAADVDARAGAYILRCAAHHLLAAAACGRISGQVRKKAIWQREAHSLLLAPPLLRKERYVRLQ